MIPTVTEDAILTALRALLLAILPAGVEVIQGQVNRVAEPSSPDFIVMTPASRTQISTNNEFWEMTDAGSDMQTVGTNSIGSSGTPVPPTVWNAERPTQISVQLDIHGPNGSDNAQTITTLWRSDFACAAVETSIFQPLFATDGRQMPFINGENQYENRWTMEVALQANPIVSTPTPFADSIGVTIEGPPDGIRT